MSFSSDIKKELCNVHELQINEMAAMLYGMFYAGRLVNGKPVIQTENNDLIAAARSLAEAVFPNERVEVTRLVKNGGSLYTFGVKSWRLTERFDEHLGRIGKRRGRWSVSARRFCVLRERH